MSFKTPFICDRRIYDKKGKWKSPNNDIVENMFYYIKEPLTLVPGYKNGREILKETITIVVFGSKPIAKEDIIILEDNTNYRISGYTLNYYESNIVLKDMLKPRVESMEIVLE